MKSEDFVCLNFMDCDIYLQFLVVGVELICEETKSHWGSWGKDDL